MTIRTLFRKHVSTILLIFGILSIRSSFADQVVVPSGSMLPTIQIGDHIWVDKAAYDLRVPFTHLRIAEISEPRRGDIIVFEDPRPESRGILLIKRLAGLPGDRVEVAGKLATVPPGHYYFLGDNRANSADSRYWGFVSRAALKGRARAVTYSVHWAGLIPQISFERSGTWL